MNKKYFYAAVVDDYQYSEVSEHRYKNFVDFIIHCWGDEDTIKELKTYLSGDACYSCDWQEFFEEYYGYGVYYFALDEDGNELDDIEDKNITLNEYIKNNFKND